MDDVDELLKKRHTILAIRAYRESFPPDRRPGLNEAVDIVLQRRDELAARGEIEAEPPDPTIDELAALATTSGPVRAIELVWDGDTFGWIEKIVAVIEKPSAEHPRYTGENVHSYRSGIGDDVGRELAARLGVPYWNPAPGTPELDAPRWWHQN